MAMKVPYIAFLKINRGATDHARLKQVIHGFNKGKKEYQIASLQVSKPGSSS